MSLTLYSAGDSPHPFPVFDLGGRRPRYILDLPGVTLPLPDEWQAATTADGHHVVVRRAHCGAGCRCAGEFRLDDSAERYLATVARGKAILDGYSGEHGPEDDVTTASDLFTDVLVSLSESHDLEELALLMSEVWDYYAEEGAGR